MNDNTKKKRDQRGKPQRKPSGTINLQLPTSFSFDNSNNSLETNSKVEESHQLISRLRHIICVSTGEAGEIPNMGLPNISTSCSVNSAIQFMIGFPELQRQVQEKRLSSTVVAKLYDVINEMKLNHQRLNRIENNSFRGTSFSEKLRHALTNFRTEYNSLSAFEINEDDRLGDSFGLTTYLITELGLVFNYADINTTFVDQRMQHYCKIISTPASSISLSTGDNATKSNIESLESGTNIRNTEREKTMTIKENGIIQFYLTERNPCYNQRLNHIYVKLNKGQQSICWNVIRSQDRGHHTATFRPKLQATVYVLNDENLNSLEGYDERTLQRKCTLKNIELQALTFYPLGHFFAARRSNVPGALIEDWIVYNDERVDKIKYNDLMNTDMQRQVLMILYTIKE